MGRKPAEFKMRTVQACLSEELYERVLAHRARMDAALPVALRGVSISEAIRSLIEMACASDAGAAGDTSAPRAAPVPPDRSGEQYPGGGKPGQPPTVSRGDVLRRNGMEEKNQDEAELRQLARVYPRSLRAAIGTPEHTCANCGMFHGTCPECGYQYQPDVLGNHARSCPWYDPKRSRS